MDKKILLVADDDAMNRMIISKFVGDEYSVIEAVDGRQTLELLQSTPVAALLLDIIMPEKDGLEVLQELRADKRFDHLGILVATSTKEKTERTALSLGADDIVSKPYDPVVIKKRLSNILAVKEANRRYELQKGESTKVFLNEELLALQKKIDTYTAGIRNCTRLISANKENIPLLTEMLSQINRQADGLDTITKES